MDGKAEAFDQPAQASVGCRIERCRQKARELACRRVGQAMMAVFPARQGGLGDAEQLGRMALLDAPKAAPPSQGPAVLIHGRRRLQRTSPLEQAGKRRDRETRRRHGHGSCMKAATRSAIIMVGALVLPPTSVGITEASTTRSPCRPRTRQRWSTTAIGSLAGPILQVPTG